MSLILVGQGSTCFRRLFSVKPMLRPVSYRHMADKHRRALLPARTPTSYLTKSLSPRRTRAAVALPRDHASRRQGHWPSPLPSTRLFAARSTSPRLCPTLECPAILATRVLAWRLALRHLAPVVALLFNAQRPVASHCRHHPQPPIPGRALH